MAALVWLLLGVALIAAEVLSGDFVLVMLGAASLSAALAHQLANSPAIDLTVFIVVALGLVLTVRPVLKHRVAVGEHKTNVDALRGATAVVVSTVDEHGGRVRIGGDLWSARAYEGAQVFEPGSHVVVMEISGATALVLAEI
ncbi:MAG: NfeD family protein [Kutzneria sp.]|nr:NfeD family protein [Kutzneria sp.]MBV9845998.1 NfeD family protein [Kutzneria sp.]